jgi:hypothetical protein
LVWTVVTAARPAAVTSEAGQAFWSLIADTATLVNHRAT